MYKKDYLRASARARETGDTAERARAEPLPVDMDPFTLTVTIVGLVAAIDSLVHLCERSIFFYKQSRWKDRKQFLSIVQDLRDGWQLLKMRIQRGEGNEQNANLAYGNILVTANILSQVEHKCSQRGFLSKATLRSIEQDLDKALILLTSVAGAYPDRASLEHLRSSHVDDFVEEINKVRDLVGGQERIMSTREMKETGFYEQDTNFVPPPEEVRFMRKDGSLYFVEMLPFADRKETKTRKSRVVLIALVLRKINVRTVLPLTKVIEHSRGVCVLSLCSNRRTLEQAIMEGKLGNRKQVISDICLAVYMIHNVLIWHKNIRLHNILVGDGGSQLTGFSGARFLQQPSGDCVLDDDRERMIYCSSDDMSEFRFSWEADMYAVGVVMLEVYSGRCLMRERGIRSREDVREAARQAEGEMGKLVRECVLTPARRRPTARMMLLALDDLHELM